MLRPADTYYANYYFDALLLLCGIHPNGEPKLFYQFLALGLDTVFIIISLYGCINVPLNMHMEIEIVCRNLMLSTSVVLSFYKYLAITYFRALLRQIRQNIRYTRLNALGNAALIRAEKPFRKIIIAFCAIFVILSSTSMLYICIAPYLVDINYRNQRYYVVPYWLICLDSMRSRSSWTLPCYNVDNYSKFVNVNLLALLLWSSQEVIIIMLILFFTFMRHYLEAQQNIIKEKLNLLSFKLNNCYENDEQGSSTLSHADRQQRYEFEYEKGIKDAIRSYQFLYRSMTEMLPFVNTLASIDLAFTLLTGPLALYPFLDKTLTSENLINRLVIAGVFFFTLVQFLYICYCAEAIKETNEIVANAVYDTPWYERRPITRKLVLRFLVILKKPIHIKCFGIFEPNFNYFARVVRTIYSVLNVMLATIVEH